MDFTNILATLTQGNNPLLLILAFFLFKDQIFALFKPKPTTDPVPPPVVVAPAPVDNNPILKVLINEVLPVLLPLLVAALKKQQEDAAK